jgi:hypothetical protein
MQLQSGNLQRLSNSFLAVRTLEIGVSSDVGNHHSSDVGNYGSSDVGNYVAVRTVEITLGRTVEI